MLNLSDIIASKISSISGLSPVSTTHYATVNDLPLTGNSDGTRAFVSDTSSLYIWLAAGSGWYKITTVNAIPTITTGSAPTYNFATDGTPIVLSLEAVDPEGLPLTWSYQITSGSLGNTAIISQVDNTFTITPSINEADVGTFEVTFTASDGINSVDSVSSFNLQFAAAPGQQEYTTPGTYSWVAPEGVTSVCVVCVGGGGGGGNLSAITGGGGGALAWKNNITVVPGNSYTVIVGDSGNYAQTSPGGDGGNSSFWTEVIAGGGKAGNSGGYGGIVSGTSSGGSGGNGGANATGSQGAGGGGAGGYSGNGGHGTAGLSYGVNGSGGGGGGGAGGTGGSGGGMPGGGVGIYGEGASGAGGNGVTYADRGGKGGSGGTDATYNNGAYPGNYGAGQAGGASKRAGYGGGAVRIIWGEGRAFPSTNTQNV